jgi:hypothetical protein
MTVLMELGYVVNMAEGMVAQAEVDSLVSAARQEGRILGQAEGKTSGKTEVLAYVQSIHEMCALAGMEKMAPDLIAKETKVEDARTQVLAARASDAEKTKIRSTVGALSTGAANPLVEDAKKRAGLK